MIRISAPLKNTCNRQDESEELSFELERSKEESTLIPLDLQIPILLPYVQRENHKDPATLPRGFADGES